MAAAAAAAGAGGARRGIRGTRWTVVMNFPSGVVKEPAGLLTHWKYACWQVERGTCLHLQMYVEMEQRGLSTLKASFKEVTGGDGYWMKALGSQASNIHYCSKPHDDCDCAHCNEEKEKSTAVPGSFKEYGTKAKAAGSGSGGAKRKAAFDLIREKGLRTVIEESPEIVATAGHSLSVAFDAVLRKKARQERGYVPPQILVLWGATEVGKTRLAYEMYPDLYKLECGETDIWWDGYYGEKCILLDDFYGQIKYSHLLNLLDGYPTRVRTKGGFVTLDNTVWIITSNAPPHEWYPKVADKKALWNRLWVRFDSCVWDSTNQVETPSPSNPRPWGGGNFGAGAPQ